MVCNDIKQGWEMTLVDAVALESVTSACTRPVIQHGSSGGMIVHIATMADTSLRKKL
jgi:hypothetical protein